MIDQNELALYKTSTIKRWFTCFLFAHLSIWVLLPSFIRGNVPFDTIESIAWGYQWQWGYDKHPPLAAWLCALVTKLAHGFVGWPVYLLAQLAVLTSFYCIWRLVNKIATPLHALISVLSLEGIIYYNLITPKINPTTMMTPIWALIILCAYFAIKEKKIWQWLVLGVLSGLAILTKYQSFLILLSVFLCICATEQGRSSFKKGGPYLAIVAFMFVLMPHILWEWHNGFPEVGYALKSTTERQELVTLGALSHIYYPLIIFLDQVGAIAPMLLMLLPFYFAKRDKTLQINTFERRFILIMGLAPFLLTLSYSLITGSYLYSKWCTPFFSLLGMVFLLYLKPQFTRRHCRYFFGLFLVIFLLIPIGRYGFLLLGPTLTGKANPDAYFPGQKIAANVSEIWYAHYPQKLRYVAGSHYLVANISAYSNDKPTPYFDWDTQQSPWVNDEMLNESGAMFVWWDGSKGDLIRDVKKRFPRLQNVETRSYAKLTRVKVPPVIVHIAILPPR